MRKIALDTNVINFCCDNGIHACDFANYLDNEQLIPFVSPYVIYELARNFSGNSKTKGQELFSFLRDLKPNYITRRDILYVLEYEKLKNDVNVNYVAADELIGIIQIRVDSYSRGVVPHFADEFISARQSSLQDTKQIWVPRGTKKTIKEKFNGSFEALINNFFDLILDRDPIRLEYMRKVISLSSEGTIKLTDDEVVTIVLNMSSYPALITVFRLYAYLNFLTETNQNVPSEDRFTDGLIMIEYSYCDLFLSNDERLVNTHAKKINPTIEVKKITFLTDPKYLNESPNHEQGDIRIELIDQGATVHKSL